MSTPPVQRFTPDGNGSLESHLAGVCDEVRAGVRALVPPGKLDGLLLAGGYGRGEGGVLRSPEGDRPYNDLEYYVFVRGHAFLAERAFGGRLHTLGERLSPAAGLEVEFKVLTLAKLRRSGPSMFYYDLVMGHRWLVGDDGLLEGCGQHRDASHLPLHEATRLLMNRCSGLLFSKVRLQRPQFGPDEADYVGRNLAKAQLALGDAVLTAYGLYHWSCRERHDRLKTLCGRLRDTMTPPSNHATELPWPVASSLPSHHAHGVEFKFHPVRSGESREVLAVRHAELSELACRIWLWLESRRLGTPFSSARDYALSPVDKCPETDGLKNRLVNARAFGAAGLADPRYPRQRLFDALSLLLWEPAALVDPASRARLRAGLQTDAADLAGLTTAYMRIWNRFN